MYYVKMMDAKQDGFKIVEVESLSYVELSRIGKNDFQSDDHDVGSPVVTLFLNIDGSEAIKFYPLGSVYILNEQGKTIASFVKQAN